MCNHAAPYPPGPWLRWYSQSNASPAKYALTLFLHVPWASGIETWQDSAKQQTFVVVGVRNER